MDSSLPNAASHLVAFKLILADYERICEYVEPTDINRTTYSHRIYELLLRTCTEFESVAKALLALTDSSLPAKNVHHYKKLDEHYSLDASQVGLQFWRPAPIYVKPFDNWAKADPPLVWYHAYNQAKHDRADRFHEANFGNLTLGIAALFLVTARAGAIKWHGSIQSGRNVESIFSFFEVYPFTQRVTDSE